MSHSASSGSPLRRREMDVTKLCVYTPESVGDGRLRTLRRAPPLSVERPVSSVAR